MSYNDKFITNIITYNYEATEQFVNTADNISKYNDYINNLIATGGTVFKKAFEKIIKVCKELES